MIFDLEASQGEWFQFFTSRINQDTGEVIYDEPSGDGKVQIRSMAPFFEERLATRKKTVEHVYNPKTRGMERISYFVDLSLDEARAEREDAWDYCITGLENFKDSKTGKVIACTRENKLLLMKIPVFDRFVARCQQLLAEAGVRQKEELEKNSSNG